MIDRFTDKRFCGEGLYKCKSREEWKIIQLMEKPTYHAIYNRLAQYEDTGLTPEEIMELKYRMESLEK